jgi:hypothetical protein
MVGMDSDRKRHRLQIIQCRRYCVGDLQINDNFGLTYLTGINFSSSEYDQRGELTNFLIDNTAFFLDNALIVDKTTFGQKIF